MLDFPEFIKPGVPSCSHPIPTFHFPMCLSHVSRLLPGYLIHDNLKTNVLPIETQYHGDVIAIVIPKYTEQNSKLNTPNFCDQIFNIRY